MHISHVVWYTKRTLEKWYVLGLDFSVLDIEYNKKFCLISELFWIEHYARCNVRNVYTDRLVGKTVFLTTTTFITMVSFPMQKFARIC